MNLSALSLGQYQLQLAQLAVIWWNQIKHGSAVISKVHFLRWNAKFYSFAPNSFFFWAKGWHLKRKLLTLCRWYCCLCLEGTGPLYLSFLSIIYIFYFGSYNNISATPNLSWPPSPAPNLLVLCWIWTKKASKRDLQHLLTLELK